MSETSAAMRDGFEVRSFEDGQLVSFVACSKEGSQREKAEMGLMRNMDLERFYVADTRDGPS